MKKENASEEPIVERLEVGPLATNCYILKSKDELMVVDPGGDGDLILDRINELGGTVKIVINTHGHIDHIAADHDIVSATGAELLVHQLDAEMLVNPGINLAVFTGMNFTSIKPARTVAEGDEIKCGDEILRVIHTPGHTPGGICLIGNGYVFTGDTLFVDSIGRVDFPGGSGTAMRASLKRLQMLLRREVMLYPGHGPTGTFGRALLVNPFLGGWWTA